jgi:hypothetical protein
MKLRVKSQVETQMEQQLEQQLEQRFNSYRPYKIYKDSIYRSNEVYNLRWILFSHIYICVMYRKRVKQDINSI